MPFVADKKSSFVPDKKSSFVPDEEQSSFGAEKQFLIGLGNSAAFGVPELVAKKDFKALESQVPSERFARGLGTTIGSVVGAPGLVFKAGSKLALKGISKIAPQIAKGATTATALQKAMVGGAGGSALFNATDPSIPMEQKPEKVLEGLVGGAVIGGVLHKLPESIRKFIKRDPKQTVALNEATKTPSVLMPTGQPATPQQSILHPSVDKFIPSQVQKVLREHDLTQAKIDASKRGILPFEIQRQMAFSLKKTQADIDNLKPGDVLNQENLRATRFFVIDNIIKSFDKNAKLINPELFKQQGENLSKVQAVSSELGRAMGSLNDDIMIAGEEFKFLQDIIKGMAPDDQKSMQHFLKNIQTPNFWDMFTEYRTAALLSSPFTHTRNMLGNSIARVYRIPEKLVAGGFDAARSLITGQPRSRFASEAVADMVGMKRAWGQALRNAHRALVDENFKSADRVLEEVKLKRALPGAAGRFIRMPFRALASMDEFFSTLSHKASFYSHATRLALKSGNKDVASRAAELIRNRSALSELAKEEALTDTLRSKLGPTGAAIQGLLNKSYTGKFLVPFFRTPVNLFKWSFDRGPLSLLSTGNWKAISKGSPEQQTEALARMAIGQVTAAGMFMEAMDGNITGRLSGNKNKRDALLRQGIQPYSVRLGQTPDGKDRWVSYRSYEPISSMLALAANTAELVQEKDFNAKDLPGKAMEIVFETIGMLKDQSFLKGISSLTNALDDPDRYAEAFIQDAVTSVIPSGVGYAARLSDPTLREIESIPDAIRNKVPGLSKGLAPKLDVWGRPINKDGSLAQRALLPSGILTSKPDITENELLSLEIFPEKIAKKYKGLNLSAEERNTVTLVEGPLVKAFFDKLVASPIYQSMSPEQQQDSFATIQSRIRTGVRKQMLSPVFLERFRSAKTVEEKTELFEKYFNQKVSK